MESDLPCSSNDRAEVCWNAGDSSSSSFGSEGEGLQLGQDGHNGEESQIMAEPLPANFEWRQFPPRAPDPSVTFSPSERNVPGISADFEGGNELSHFLAIYGSALQLVYEETNKKYNQMYPIQVK